MSVKHGRSKARECALQSLYSMKFNPLTLDVNDKLALTYVEGVSDNIDTIDSLIKPHLKKWTIQQLNPVDLAILRIAVYELTNLETPRPVVVNEALELAKKYSTDESKKFIHFVLDQVCKDIDGSNN